MLLDALAAGRQIAPLSDRSTGFDLDRAYEVAEAILRARMARGERPAGWKIGFTNRTIWDEYGVHAPIWGPIYDTTLIAALDAGDILVIDAGAYIEPRIEPEIVFRMAATPEPGMDERGLLGCIDAVAHGFEIVQSVYPGWRFAAADTAAAFGMHGSLVVGPFASVTADNREAWLDKLARFEIALARDGREIDRGQAANVLGGPVAALRHFVRGLAARPVGRGIEPGDLVTTGTVTRAFPVFAGETWATTLAGIPLPAMRIRFGDALEAATARWVTKAAEARFRFENPQACDSPTAYEAAMAAGVEAEAELSRLLFRDAERLAEARAAIARRATALADQWKAARKT